MCEIPFRVGLENRLEIFRMDIWKHIQIMAFSLLVLFVLFGEPYSHAAVFFELYNRGVLQRCLLYLCNHKLGPWIRQQVYMFPLLNFDPLLNKYFAVLINHIFIAGKIGYPSGGFPPLSVQMGVLFGAILFVLFLLKKMYSYRHIAYQPMAHWGYRWVHTGFLSKSYNAYHL